MRLPCSAIRILLVDDDEAFRDGLAANLRDDGHEVYDFGDALHAQECSRPADVLITDYEMRPMDGLSFADEVWAARGVPVVLVTAYWTADLESQIAARGFLRLYRKPVDYDELHQIVHDLADSARGSR